MKVEPGRNIVGDDPPSEQDRLSWAAYFGAAFGLVVGMVLAMVGAAALHYHQPDSRLAEFFWEVGSPVLAVLGFIGGGFFFHQHLRGQVVVPVILFLAALALGVWLASGPVGFPWKQFPS